MPPPLCFPRRTTLLAVAVAGLAGCSPSALDSPTAKKLRGLSEIYVNYAIGHGGTGPRSDKELRQYVVKIEEQSLPPEVDRANREAIFVSDRDQQPFAIVPGVGIRGLSATSAPLVVYEQTGADGKRLAAFANSKLELVDDGRLQELLGKSKP